MVKEEGNYYFPDVTESHFDNIMEKTHILEESEGNKLHGTKKT